LATGAGKKLLRQGHFTAAMVILLSASLFCHLWLTVNPRLIHHNQTPVFIAGADFLESFLSRPGGPLAYLSLLLAQLLHFPAAGALLITVVTLLICLSGRRVLTATGGGGKSGWALCMVPVLLVMLIYSRYGVDLQLLLQIMVALLLTALYGRLPLRRWPVRLGLFLVASAPAYYITGSGYLLLAVMCGILEIITRRSIIPGFIMVLCGLAAPYAYSVYSYKAGLADAYAPLLPVGKKVLIALAPPAYLRRSLHIAMAAFFPLAAIWSAARRWLARSSADRDIAGTSIWPLAALALVTILAGPVSADRLTRTLIEIDYASRNRQWQRVLTNAERLPVAYNNIYVMHAANKALYHTGRLPYEMFRRPQTTERDSVFLVFALPSAQRGRYDKLSEVFYELGFVNESEHFAHEALERHGPQPQLLKRLAKINVLKGSTLAARTFLSALARQPLHRRWATDYLAKLDADPRIPGDSLLQAARSRMIQLDYTIGSGGYDQQIGPTLVNALEHKLRAGGQSRATYEYLLAHYLWTRRIDKVVSHLGRLDSFGYEDIPTHWQEAILLHAVMTGRTNPDFHGRRVGKATRDMLQSYGAVIKRLGSDKPALYEALMDTHDRTYFLYYTVGFSDSRLASLSDAPDTTTAATK